jgi:hypothetical protein
MASCFALYNGRKGERLMLSVGITTFKYRFESFFIPLLTKIKTIAPDIEVVVAINGEHLQPLDENYRSRILRFIADQKNVIPIMFPCFRALAKLWNHILITSSNDYVFLLNDDVQITDDRIFEKLTALLIHNHFYSFKLNKHWSMVLLNKWEVDQLGYFDERLLGIGNEDHDFEWRYGKFFGREFVNLEFSGIEDFWDPVSAPVNIKPDPSNKYSLFNANFIHTEKYRVDETLGEVHGTWPNKRVLVIEDPKQYPHEAFYKQRKTEL